MTAPIVRASLVAIAMTVFLAIPASAGGDQSCNSDKPDCQPCDASQGPCSGCPSGSGPECQGTSTATEGERDCEIIEFGMPPMIGQCVWDRITSLVPGW